MRWTQRQRMIMDNHKYITDHIEIEQPPVTQEVIDEGGEADDEVDTETENDIGQS